MNRFFTPVLPLVCVALTVAQGCATPSSAPVAPAPIKLAGSALRPGSWIAVIGRGGAADYWRLIHQGVVEGGKEAGVKVLWLRLADEGEAQAITDCLGKHVSGIVLAPSNEREAGPPVMRAEAAGVPVVLIDAGFKDIPVAATVETDNYRAGCLSGQRTMELLNGKGSALVIGLHNATENLNERQRGFVDTLKGSGIKILSGELPPGSASPNGVTASERLISQFDLVHHPDIAVVTMSASTSEAMLAALEATSLGGKVKFVGFDATGPLIKGLNECKVDTLVAQNPRLIGYLGVKSMVTKLEGEYVDPDIKTDTMLVDRSNVKSQEVRALIAPPVNASLP
jgi:ribose transport system substrate-binding protein